MVTNSTASVATDIRDIKPPVEIPNGWEWLWWTLAVLAIIVLAILLWRWWQRKQANARVEMEVPPHERARRKLQEALDYFDRPKPFCILVSDAVRLYLEERFGLRAPERTTEEFLADLSRSVALTDRQKASLQEFLTACDMVKFAKYEPRRPELESLYNSALRLIEETEPKPELPPIGENSSANRQSPIANPK
jgi:hypothetical protein